jgi:hypothetical protein
MPAAEPPTGPLAALTPRDPPEGPLDRIARPDVRRLQPQMPFALDPFVIHLEAQGGADGDTDAAPDVGAVGSDAAGADAVSLPVRPPPPAPEGGPHLAYAAALASGLDGIERELEPPAAVDGDVYGATELPLLPRSLREATDLFEASDFARAAFGEDVVAHYVHFFRTEQAAFDASVTDWERQRYFERI